ncbi:hypothetical protein A6X21_02735 [Planctopirus hydrillae]|uniref:Uncharacterized protein n=1 Tax=Planctopirus hydrillae TaxID=1841610 RepID=A0A1C3EMZ7_9PLAN|nr:hypothetical protein A6X21_02735 [Planctopirus hydrillae]
MCLRIKPLPKEAAAPDVISTQSSLCLAVSFAPWICVFLLAIVVTGCGSRVAVDSRAKGPVAGRILVDGKPIEVEGVSLVLMPADQSAAVTIPVSKEGTFAGQAPLGKHYVSISAGHTPDAGHGEGPKVGFGSLFLSTESPLMITVAESATPQDLEVGNAAAKKQEPNRRRLGPATTPRSH